MSVQPLTIFRFFKNHPINLNLIIRTLSRRSNNAEGPYKVIKSKRQSKADGNLVWRDPNFDLLDSTSGSPFFLPGNIGPAWHDATTTVTSKHSFVMEELENDGDVGKNPDGNIVCRVQECPTVLRQTVCDLFPNRSLENSELSVITISLRPDIKIFRSNKEVETEKMAQVFVLAAKNICEKLRKAGYWADFINPFSGRPYLFPNAVSSLYETDEKFRCLDFQIFEISDCKIVSNEQSDSKRFIGSLFTNAPSKKNHLNNIFTK